MLEFPGAGQGVLDTRNFVPETGTTEKIIIQTDISDHVAG